MRRSTIPVDPVVCGGCEGPKCGATFLACLHSLCAPCHARIRASTATAAFPCPHCGLEGSKHALPTQGCLLTRRIFQHHDKTHAPPDSLECDQHRGTEVAQFLCLHPDCAVRWLCAECNHAHADHFPEHTDTKSVEAVTPLEFPLPPPACGASRWPTLPRRWPART